MKAVVLFVILFIEACISAPNNHLLDLKHNTIVSSVTGLADSCPTLLNDPVGAYRNFRIRVIAVVVGQVSVLGR